MSSAGFGEPGDRGSSLWPLWSELERWRRVGKQVFAELRKTAVLQQQRRKPLTTAEVAGLRTQLTCVRIAN